MVREEVRAIMIGAGTARSAMHPQTQFEGSSRGGVRTVVSGGTL